MRAFVVSLLVCVLSGCTTRPLSLFTGSAECPLLPRYPAPGDYRISVTENNRSETIDIAAEIQDSGKQLVLVTLSPMGNRSGVLRVRESKLSVEMSRVLPPSLPPADILRVLQLPSMSTEEAQTGLAACGVAVQAKPQGIYFQGPSGTTLVLSRPEKGGFPAQFFDLGTERVVRVERP